MEPINGGSFVGDEKGAPPPPPSPLTGSYLLVIIGEPHCQQHKDIILQKIAKGLLSWDLKECLVDLEKELNIITEQSLDGEEARYGERLIQFASENLVTEILIHPAVSTLSQCVRNLLSSFTRHRHIIHAGYTFQANGSWALQDGTFSYSDFAEAFQEIEVQRVIHAYENGISIDLHCSPEGDWSRLCKENFAKACKIRFNPTDVLTAGSPSISSFTKYLEPFLVPTVLEEILESSDVVGNIRFSRPTLYVFPGGQGDAALFGINGFNMLLDGGYSRKACFWDFVRHLDRLDAVLMSRLNNSNVSGISSVLKRKTQGAVYPQIGHFFCNIQERKSLLSPDGDKDKDPLIINLLDEGQSIVQDLHSLNLSPQPCYRDSDPIILYHKVGHGTLNMFVLSPEKNSREVREFLQKWNQTDNKLFGHVRGKEFTFPLENLISICALLVWQPSNPNDTITRILYPGSSPQKNILEGLDRLKNMEFMKHPTCLVKSYITVKKSKQDVIDKLATNKESKFINEKKMENKALIEDIKKNVEMNGDVKEKQVKKSDSLDSDKEKKPKKIDDRKKTDKSDDVSNGDKPKPRMKPVEKPKVADDGKEKKKPIDRKGPPTPKKTLENRRNGEVKDKDKRILQKSSPGATPAKSTKDENNRKVIENKKAPQKKEPSPPKPAAAETKAKYERKPISRRPKSTKGPPSPMKKMTNGIQKPDLLIKRGKLDKEGTTDSSTVSTPSAEQESVLKKDLSKLTPEEIQLLKDTEIDELNEEQEAVKEIEAVFRKGEKIAMEDTEPGVRKIKDISIGDHLDTEEYLIIEKEEVDSTDQENKEDEMKKLTRDSEESEKLRKSDGKDSDESKDMIQPSAKQQVVESVEPKKLSETTDSRKQSIISPEDKISSAEKKDEEAKEVVESQPDEKVSANVESGATTTAPTLPEDERITLDGIKEDIGQAGVEEKYVKEETKEIVEIPIIQLPPKSQQESQIKPAIIASIPLDKQKHVRDIVKTPDEVADLPVHEEVDYHDFQRDEKKLMNESGTDKTEKKEIPKKSEEVKAEELKEEEPLIKDFSKNEEKVTGKIEAVEISNVDVKSPKTEVELKKDEKIEVLEKAETETKEKADQDNNLVAEDKNIKEIDDEDWVVITTENGTDDIHDDHQVEKEIKAPGEKIIENAERKPILEDPKSHDIIENVKDEIKQLDSDSDHEVRKEDEIDEKFEEDKEDIKVLLAEADKKPISVTVAENKCEHVPESVEALKKDLIDDTDKKIKSIKEDKHEINEIDNKLQELKKEMEQPDVDDVKIGNLENNLGKTEEATNVDMKKDFKELEKYEEILNGLKKDDKPSVKDDEIKFEVSRKNVEHAEAVILPADSSSSEEDDGPLIFKELAIDKAELGRKSPAEREEDVKKIVASVAVVLKSEVPLEEIKTKALAFTQELRETHITTQESPLLEIQVIKNEEIPVIPEETTDEEDEIRNAKIDADIEKEVEDIMRDDKDDDATVHRMLVTASSEDGGEETEICPAGSITFSKSSESSERSSPEPSQKTPSQKSSVVETLSDTTISTNKQISEIAAPKLEDKNDVTIKEETKDVVDEKVQNLKEKDVETTQMEIGADIVEDMAENRRTSIAESVGKIEGKIEDAIDFIEHKVSDYLVSRKDSLKESEKHIEEKLNQQDEGIIEKTEEFIEDTKDAFTDVLSAVADKAHSIFDGIIKSEPEEAEIKTKDSVILEDTDGVKSKDEVNKVESVITDAKIQEDAKPDELQKVQDQKIPPLVADDDDSKVEIESSEKESKTPKQRRRSSVVEAAEDFMEKSEKVFDSVFSAIGGAAKSLIHEVFDDKEQKIEDKKPILEDLVPESEKPKLDVKHETVKQDAALEDSISTLNEVTDEKVKLERRLDESKTTSELVSEKVIPLVINADKIEEKEIGIESIKKDEQHLEEKIVKASETPSPAAGVKIEKGKDEINKDQESEISKKLVSEQSIKKIIDPITIDSLGKDEKHSKEEIVKRSEALLSPLEDKVDKISAESTPEKLTKDEWQPQEEKYVEISKTSVKKDETHVEDVDVNVQETSSKQIDSMDNKLIQETKEKEAKISTEPPSEKTSSLEAQTEKEKDLEISKASVKKDETHVHKVEVNVQETSSKQIDSMDNKLMQETKEKEAKIITELPSEKTSGFEAQTEKGKDDQMSKENLQKDGETTKVPEKLPQAEQKVEKENKVESSEATLKITKEEISEIPVELEEKDTIKKPSKDSVEKNEESLEEEMEKVEKSAPTLGAKAAIDAEGQKELKDAADETVGKQILETPEALEAPVELDQSRKESLQKDDKSMKEEIDKIHDMFAQVEDIIEKHKDELKSKASEFLSEKPTEIKTHEGDLSINKLKKVVEGKQAETPVKDAEKTQEISPVKEKTEKSALVTESVIPVEKRTELEKVAEGSSTKEVVKEYKVAAEILKKDEKQIENEAKHLEENYKDLNTLTDSLSFDKCKVADEFKLDEKTLKHEEDQLQMEADGIRKDYEELNELSKSVSFEKCKINYDDFHLDNITLEKEEKLLEKEAVQLENVYEDVKKLSEEVSFEKCKNIEEFKVEKDVLEKEEKQIEKQVEEVEKSFDDLKKLSKEVSFEKCKSPQEFKVEKDVIEKEEKQIEEEVEVVKKSLEDLKKLSDEVVFEKCVINEVIDDKKTEEEINKIKLEAQKEKITEKLDVNELKEEQNLVAKLPKEIEEPHKIVEECAFDKDVLKKEEIDIKKEAKKLDENLEDIMKLSAEVAFDKSKVLDDVKVSKNLLQKEEIQTKKEGSENQATFESAKKKSEEIFDKSKETDDKPLVGQSKGPLDDTAKESKDKVQLEDFTKEEKLEKSITATEKQDFKDHDAEDHKPEKTETPLSKKDLQKNEKQLGDEVGEINNIEYDHLRKLSEELQFESGDFKLDKNTLAKDEMQLQKEADHLEKSFEDVSKLSEAVVFEKCKQLPDEYETDQEIITKYDTKQIGFEETRRKSVENLPDLGASISFDKCHPPHEFDVEDPIIESGAETAKTADKKDKTTDDKTEKYHKLENGSGTKDMPLNLEAEPICKKKDLDEEEKFPTLSVEHTEAKKLSISDVEISIKTDDVDHKDIIQSFLDNERTNICDSTDAKVYVEPANSQASSIISLSTYETEKTPSDVESSGKTTPPTVPLSPVGKDLKMPVTKHDSGLSEPTETDEDDLSTKSQIANSQSDLDENDMRMDPMSASFYEPEILEKDQIIATTYLHEGSKDSKVSTELHTETADTIKFVKGEIDPMTASFIGELPSGESSEIKHERKDSILGEPVPHTYLYEVTKARFALEQKDVMTSSFIGDQLPSSSKTPDNKESDPMTTSVYFEASSDDKKDPIASWGKPLGLPSPAPPNNNDKGTPKKEKRLPSYVSAKNKLNNNDDKRRSESPSKLKAKRMNPVYVDLTYVPHHGNHYYSFVEYFKRIRARYYVFSGLEPSRQVYDALLEAKQTWDDKELEVTIIPTYDTDILGYWVAENEELLTKLKIDLAPSASRCTINLQDHETSCSAYRLEF